MKTVNHKSRHQLTQYEKNHIKALRDNLAECMVLLKSNGDFPIDRPCKIALYGSGARHTVKGGTGSGEVNSRYFVTVEKGLKRAGFEITTNDWLDEYDKILPQAKKTFYANLRKKARKMHTSVFLIGMGAIMPEPEYDIPLSGDGDVAIYVLSRISGEGNDRELQKGDFLLTDSEVRDILACQKKYKKFMLVINAGGPVDLSLVKDVDNILVLSQLGVETGAALADVILGKTNPSGKLTTTWTDVRQISQFDFGDMDDTRYKEGIYVGYRYYDTCDKRTLFPFGYGLSYTSFDMSDCEVSNHLDEICVKARITNTGDMRGKEVLEVYISAPNGKLDKPYKELVGFAKTESLEPGENDEIEVRFSLSNMASFFEKESCFVLESGEYYVSTSFDSEKLNPVCVIRLDENIVTKKVKNLSGKPDFCDFSPEKIETKKFEIDADTKQSLKEIKLTSADFSLEECTYDRKYEIDPWVRILSDEDLAYTVIGNFLDHAGVASVIGEASSVVAGAAGESTSRVKGFPTIVMADGPAGLRIAPKYFHDEKGAHGVDVTMPESVRELLPGFVQKMTRLVAKTPPKDAKIKEQYCTAIPIGTAIAQSFNTRFARTCGDIVGAEMELFNVDLWLAPALNIHRNIRCGRNFEYYSEDPILSGKMAAAITNGVQSHDKKGVTIKHFVANNQETNRYCNNSVVSERAMREIYLKGFEICIKESNPISVMSSYNLLNGIHTSERRDLIEDVLRCEFGFDGIVMTDWITGDGFLEGKGKYKFPKIKNVISSGHELFMPGSSKNHKDLVKALKSGEIDRKTVEINATRLRRLAKRIKEK